MHGWHYRNFLSPEGEVPATCNHVECSARVCHPDKTNIKFELALNSTKIIDFTVCLTITVHKCLIVRFTALNSAFRQRTLVMCSSNGTFPWNFPINEEGGASWL